MGVMESLLLVSVVLCLSPALEGHQRKVKHQHLCPFPCSCADTGVYCDRTHMFSLPLHIPKDTTSISAKHNFLKHIRRVQLRGLRQLHSLSLRYNQINKIDPDAFWGLRKLRSLTLRDNNIETILPHTFKGLHNLQDLSFRNNKLESLEGLLKGLRSLRLLSAGDNAITKITARTFKSCVRLYVLDLHNNSISSIHRKAFLNLPYLRYLILRDNPLVHVDLDFKFNFHLELMDFTNCQLNEVVKGLPKSIRDLRISENNITSLQAEAFQRTRKIRLLLLSDNRMTEVNKATFQGLFILYELHLSNNSLSYVPPNLPRSLRGLYLVNNSITDLQDTDLEGNDKLETLLLNINFIQSIGQKAFQFLHRLKNLDLSANQIETLQPNLFERTKKLELLDISNNPIESADPLCFQGLKNLHILQMSSLATSGDIKPNIFKNTHSLLFLDLSNSSQIAKNFAESPFLLDYISSVQDLNLMSDGIYSLPADFPNHFPYLKIIKLVENPWHCDRSIYWLTKWMNNNTIEFFEQDNMLCESPPELRGRMISSLVLEEIPEDPEPEHNVTPNIDIIDIPFTLGRNYTLQVGDDEAFNATLMEQAGNDSDIFPEEYEYTTEQEVELTTVVQTTSTQPPVSTTTKLTYMQYREKLAQQRLEKLLSKKKKTNKHKFENDINHHGRKKYTGPVFKYIDSKDTWKNDVHDKTQGKANHNAWSSGVKYEDKYNNQLEYDLKEEGLQREYAYRKNYHRHRNHHKYITREDDGSGEGTNFIIT